jgi:hypothetical protein
MPDSSSLDIVSNFIDLLDEKKNYEAAADFLVDDFQFLTPKTSFKNKDDWLKRFPEAHKDQPIFEQPTAGSNEKQVLRKGKKKVPYDLPSPGNV